MRHVTSLVCLMILASAAGVMSEETAEIDAASALGIRISSEIDPIDPSWVRCTVDWLRPSDEATVSILGPASVVATSLTESGAQPGSRWSSDVFRVDAGHRSELLLELAPNNAAQPVMVLVERLDGSVIFQAGMSLDFDGATRHNQGVRADQLPGPPRRPRQRARRRDHRSPRAGDRHQGADLR